MAIYKNIDGTTRPSFKIGVRGITIRPEAVISGQETLERIAIEKNGNKRYLLYEGDIEVPKTYCSKIEQNASKTTTTFYIKNPDGTTSEVIVSTREGGVIGPESAVENNLASFADNSGQELKDSGVSVKNTISLTDGKGSLSEVPSAAAVVDYVGSISDILEQRVRGKI